MALDVISPLSEIVKGSKKIHVLAATDHRTKWTKWVEAEEDLQAKVITFLLLNVLTLLVFPKRS